MATFIPHNRDQSFLLPPELKDWLAADDLAHCVVAAVERLRPEPPPMCNFTAGPKT